MERKVRIETTESELEGFTFEDSDLDGEFLLKTLDGEVFKVNGWACDVTDLGLVRS